MFGTIGKSLKARFGKSKNPGLFKRFSQDQEGVVAIEFAGIATLLGVTMLLGGWELATATMVKKRVDANTQMITDLVAQETVFDYALFSSYADFLARNVHPYKSAATKEPVQVHIIGVTVDSRKRARISWEYRNGSTKLVSEKDLPKNLVIADTFYVIGAQKYSYRPMFAGDLIGNMNFFDKSIMAPRNSLTIAAR